MRRTIAAILALALFPVTTLAAAPAATSSGTTPAPAAPSSPPHPATPAPPSGSTPAPAAPSSGTAAPPPAQAVGTNLGSVTGGKFRDPHVLIDKKCTSCHTDDRIQKALAAGMDMQIIQKRMEKKGVNLTVDEHDVLGVFWKETPLKPKK